MSISTIAQSTNAGISNVRDYLDTKVDSILKPKAADGISGFVFDVADSDDLTDESEVTDHWTEDNSFLNDHIVQKPIKITLSGFIGELTYQRPKGIEGALQELGNRLELVDAYLGDYTPGFVQQAQGIVSQAESVVSQVNQTLDRVQNIVSALDGETAEPTAQEKAFRELFALKRAKEIVTVQTPWGYFDNMIITMISYSQDSETRSITSITVSLKEVRFAEVKTTSYETDLFPPRVNTQEEEKKDIGRIQGREESFAFSVLAGG